MRRFIAIGLTGVALVGFAAADELEKRAAASRGAIKEFRGAFTITQPM